MTKQITTLGSVSLAVKAVVGTAGLVGTVVRKGGDMALDTEVGKALHNDAYGELIKGEGTSQELVVDKVVSLVSSEKEVKEPTV